MESFSGVGVLRLTMGEAVRHGASGGSDVHYGNPSLEFVMARLMEEVAQAHYACSFSDEVQGETCRGATKDANDWIQFPAAILEIRTGNREVSSVQRGCRDEQQLVLPVPELVFACYRLWNGDKGRRMFNESHGHRRVRNGSLGQRNGASHEDGEKHYSSRTE